MRNILRAVAVLAALAPIGGCHRADSVLLVEVSGDETLAIVQLSATVTIATTNRMFMVPETPTSIQLPTSFAVDLDRNLTGPVTVSVEALGAGGSVLGSGRAVQEHINLGDDTIVPVTLSSPAPLAGDAGVGRP